MHCVWSPEIVSVHRYAGHMDIDFTVKGIPIPKGSMRHIGNGRMVDQTKTKPWMNSVRSAALLSARERGLDGMIDVPVRVEITLSVVIGL